MKTKRATLAPIWCIIVSLLLSYSSTAQTVYNASAGINAPTAVRAVEVMDADGKKQWKEESYRPAEDKYGNVAGNEYDLAVDGAFEGQTVAVIHLYTGEGFDFSLPKAALKEKGFGVYRWSGNMPCVKDLKAALEKSCQLWLISDSRKTLTDEHVKVIKDFFDAGHGVYIWGDNKPYYTDANILSEALLGTTMKGNLPGNNVVDVLAIDEKAEKKVGLKANHLITTGIEQLYEGITIATLAPSKDLEPILYGSAGNLVTSVYDKHKKRAIVDGGFTRLYCHWDTAGTARYVKNAAAWLANVERFPELADAKE